MSEFKLKNKKAKSDILNIIVKYLPCLVKGGVITAIGILVLSFAYYKMSSHSIILYYLNYLFIALGAFITGNSTYYKFGGRGIVAGGLGVIPLIFFELISIFAFSYTKISIFIIIILLICFSFGAIGGIIASNTKKRY